MTEAPTQPLLDTAALRASTRDEYAAAFGTIGAGLRSRKPGAFAPGAVQ